MTPFLLYIGRSSLYLALFYAFFLLVMRRTTFFRLNRILLLAGTVACFLLPMLRLRTVEVPFLMAGPLTEAASEPGAMAGAAPPPPRPNHTPVAPLIIFVKERAFLEREPMANTFRYHVKVTEKQYRGETVGEMVAQYYNNSYASLVSQFVEEDKMNLQELKDLIARIENARK